MTKIPLNVGWNATDDVPESRDSGATKSIKVPSSVIADTRSPTPVQLDPRMMHLSAFAGIAIVLLITAFSAGIFSDRRGKTVALTGNAIPIPFGTNDTPIPFGDPVSSSTSSASIPIPFGDSSSSSSSSSGGTSSTNSSSSASNGGGTSSSTSLSSSSSSSSLSSSITSSITTSSSSSNSTGGGTSGGGGGGGGSNGGGGGGWGGRHYETPYINVGENRPTQSPYVAYLGNQVIPTNPYTVATRNERSTIAQDAYNAMNDIRDEKRTSLESHRPHTTTESGPADITSLMLISTALCGMIMRATRVL